MGQSKNDTLPQVTYYVIVDSIKIEVSGRQLTGTRFDPNWIESISVMKHSGLQPSGFIGEQPLPSIVIIHIKQEYNQKVLKRLKK